MTLNGDKFEHHRIGKNLDIEKYSYKDPTEENIIEKEYIKDLGVYILLFIIIIIMSLAPGTGAWPSWRTAN